MTTTGRTPGCELVGPSSGRSYLRLIVGTGRDHGLACINSGGVSLGGGRHTDICGQSTPQGVVQMHDADGERHA